MSPARRGHTPAEGARLWCSWLVPETTDPVVVAFDGSDESRAAVTAAARLFADRPLLIVTVWEPALALVAQSYPDPITGSWVMPTPEMTATVERTQREHAEATADAGARLAGSLGAEAEPLAIPDGDIAEAIGAVTDERNAAALVVGSRGLGAMKSKLFGSTSRRLLHESRRPVLIVRAVE
jgi:nucleotide-binding universal stress UspA family protein